MKKHKNKIIAGAVIIAALAAALFWGGFGTGGAGDSAVSGTPPGGFSGEAESQPPETFAAASGTEPAQTPDSGKGAANDASPPPPEEASPLGSPPTEEVSPSISPNPDNSAKPIQTPVTGEIPPSEPDSANPSSAETGQPDDTERELTCTLTVSCAAILDNLDKLADGKEGLVPSDGIIFSETVTFYEGESVFNVFLREMKKNKIQMEFVNAPLYNSAYIEGIGNIYEFDCGERSGWMYSVNGVFPNYGSSRYELQDGDVIKWLYSCDRGADIGGSEAADSYVKE